MTPSEFFMHLWMLFCCLNPRLGLSMTHTPRMHITLFTHATVTYNKKQSAAVMNSLYCKCRGKGSDVTQDGPALMLSVNFVERRQTTPCCVLPAPRERRRFSPTPGPTHTSHFSSPAPGVGARGGKCNINPPPLYYVLICSSSWLLHMTCPVICIALASHFLISQSLSTEALFFLGTANFDELFWRSTKQPCLADMQVLYMLWYIFPSKHDTPTRIKDK